MLDLFIFSNTFLFSNLSGLCSSNVHIIYLYFRKIRDTVFIFLRKTLFCRGSPSFSKPKFHFPNLFRLFYDFCHRFIDVFLLKLSQVLIVVQSRIFGKVFRKSIFRENSAQDRNLSALPTRIEDLENENFSIILGFSGEDESKVWITWNSYDFLKLMLPCDVHFRLQKSRTFLGTSPSFLWSCISRPKFSRSCYFSRSVKSRIIYFPIFPKIFPKFSSFIYSRHIRDFSVNILFRIIFLSFCCHFIINVLYIFDYHRKIIPRKTRDQIKKFE